MGAEKDKERKTATPGTRLWREWTFPGKMPPGRMFGTVPSAAISQAAEALKAAQAVIVTCGAGLGVDSGLPDFRGNEGFWREYPPIAARGLSFSECADPEHFEHDPSFAWGFYGHRMNLYRDTAPGPHFDLLQQIFQRAEHGGFVFTTNVDGQFQQAGFDQSRIVEVHGSIHHVQAVSGRGGIVPVDSSLRVPFDPKTFRADEPLPQMPDGQPARPNILMFGDYFWDPSRTGQQQARMSNWLEMLQRDHSVRKMVVIDIGSGSAVPTARITGARLTQQFPDGKLIRINPREPEVDRGYGSVSDGTGIAIEQGAFVALSQIVDLM